MLLEERVARPTTEAEAVALARELYRLEVAVKSLPGEYDDNFHLTTLHGVAGAQPEFIAHKPRDGAAVAVPRSGDSAAAGFVLKVMHPARERSFIDLQCRALTHLAQRAPQLPLPRVAPNRSGEQFISIVAADGSTRLVWLLTFVTGAVLAEVRPHTLEL